VKEQGGLKRRVLLLHNLDLEMRLAEMSSGRLQIHIEKNVRKTMQRGTEGQRPKGLSNYFRKKTKHGT